MVARGRRLLWAASSPLEPSSAGPHIWRLGPATRAFPLADGSVRVTPNFAFPRPNEDYDDPGLLAAVVRTCTAYNAPCPWVEVEIAHGDPTNDDSAEGLVAALVQRQRITLQRWFTHRAASARDIAVSASDLNDWLGGRVEPDVEGFPPSHPFAFTEQRLLNDVSAQDDRRLEIIELGSAPGRGDTANRRFEVRFKAAVRGDHILIADIVGERLVGHDGKPTNCIGFQVERDELTQQALDISEEPYSCVELAAQGEQRENAALAGGRGILRSWLHAALRGAMPPTELDLLPLYALAYEPYSSALGFRGLFRRSRASHDTCDNTAERRRPAWHRRQSPSRRAGFRAARLSRRD